MLQLVKQFLIFMSMSSPDMMETRQTREAGFDGLFLKKQIIGPPLCANMHETTPMTPVHCEGTEVNHHDDDSICPRSSSELRRLQAHSAAVLC